jgi:hypothetical protein
MIRFFVAVIFCFTTVIAQAGAPHQHGVGQLQVALEQGRVDVVLTLAAIDLVGFEHAPGNAAQRKAISEAVARLQRAGEVLQFPADAQCELVSVNVAGELLEAEHQHDQHHGHQHEQSGHASFIASYRFACLAPARLQQAELTLFRWLDGLTLQAELLHQDGVRLARLSRRTPQLLLTPAP